MGRKKEKKTPGRPVSENKKTHKVEVRLSEQEALLFDQLFRESRYTNKSEFIRNSIFNGASKLPDMPLNDYYNCIAPMVREINSIGVNINQIAKKVNSMADETSLRIVKYEINKALSELVYCKQTALKVMDYLSDFRSKYL